ncbi:permeases of the major facilitator superfamily [Moorella thermoacetica Y72]|uniref:Permeases of the major facilitator superfamily n=1 Tax=Moorella thermoacetica Y72 TaxID=1325331 RepID=A0A0S6UIL6_NEOTH|nr:permeases of the major facilitator superfamily [Moorella thermoacetica Y72]
MPRIVFLPASLFLPLLLIRLAGIGGRLAARQGADLYLLHLLPRPCFPVQGKSLAVFHQGVNGIAGFKIFREVCVLSRLVHKIHSHLDRGILVGGQGYGLADIPAAQALPGPVTSRAISMPKNVV